MLPLRNENVALHFALWSLVREEGCVPVVRKLTILSLYSRLLTDIVDLFGYAVERKWLTLNSTGFEILESQVKMSFLKAQGPFRDESVKVSSVGININVNVALFLCNGHEPEAFFALNVAQVPDEYQVPRPIMQPRCWPIVETTKLPLPTNGVPVGLGGCRVVVGFPGLLFGVFGW